jgi:hypothetical protein
MKSFIRLATDTVRIACLRCSDNFGVFNGCGVVGVEMIVDFRVAEVATSRQTEPDVQNRHRQCRIDHRGNEHVGMNMPFSTPVHDEEKDEVGSDYGDEEFVHSDDDESTDDRFVQSGPPKRSSESTEPLNSRPQFGTKGLGRNVADDNDLTIAKMAPSATFIPSIF